MSGDIAELIAETKAWLAEYGDPELAIHDYAARLANALEASQPRVVTTVEELDALPDGSLIYMTNMRRPFQKIGGLWESTWRPGKPVHDYTGLVSGDSPATVLWTPTGATR